MLAAGGGDFGVIQVLLQHGADVNAQSLTHAGAMTADLLDAAVKNHAGPPDGKVCDIFNIN